MIEQSSFFHLSEKKKKSISFCCGKDFLLFGPKTQDKTVNLGVVYMKTIHLSETKGYLPRLEKLVF